MGGPTPRVRSFVGSLRDSSPHSWNEPDARTDALGGAPDLNHGDVWKASRGPVSDGRREDDDVAWLLARAKAQPGPSISETSASRYEKLEALLGDLPAAPAETNPTQGWQARVLAAIDAEEAGRAASTARGRRGARRWVPWLVPLGVAVVGAAAVGGVQWLRADAPRAIAMAPILEVRIEAAGSSLPAMAPAMVGDAVVARGSVEGAGELRVYDDGGAELVRCAAPAADCSVTRFEGRSALQLTMTLRARGAFHPLLFAPPLPGPSAGLERDLEAARQASLDVLRGDPVIVP